MKKTTRSAGFKIGSRAPEFTLCDQTGQSITLAELLARGGGGATLLYFYPEADTPACTMQACELGTAMARLNELGVGVAGMSPDTPEVVAAFARRFKVPFTLLADPRDGAGVPRAMRAYHAFGEKNLYGKVVTGVIRSAVLINADGTIARHWPVVKATGFAARMVRDAAEAAAPRARRARKRS